MCDHPDKCTECGFLQFFHERVTDAFDIDEYAIKKEYYGDNLGFNCGGCGERDCEHSTCPECEDDYCLECSNLHTCQKCKISGCKWCVFECQTCVLWLCMKCIDLEQESKVFEHKF